jgi:hypothetical protein
MNLFLSGAGVTIPDDPEVTIPDEQYPGGTAEKAILTKEIQMMSAEVIGRCLVLSRSP